MNFSEEVYGKVKALDLDSVKSKFLEDKNKSRWIKLKAEQVDQICREYREFLYLASLSEVVPWSQELDDFWHTHILDTEKYMADCQLAFGKYIHHRPGKTSKDGIRQTGKMRQELKSTLSRNAMKNIFSFPKPTNKPTNSTSKTKSDKINSIRNKSPKNVSTGNSYQSTNSHSSNSDNSGDLTTAIILGAMMSDNSDCSKDSGSHSHESHSDSSSSSNCSSSNCSSSDSGSSSSCSSCSSGCGGGGCSS